MTPKPLKADELIARVPPSEFAFKSTAELDDLTEPFGQARALEAIRFGAEMSQRGYNIYVCGAPGAGKHLAVRGFIERIAERRHAPCDWAYVHNFKSPQAPRALRLESGRAEALRASMEELIDDLKTAIPAVFESDEYRRRRQTIDQEVNAAPGEAFDTLAKRAAERGIALLSTQSGPMLAPMGTDKVLSQEEFNALPEATREQISTALGELREELQHILMKVPAWEKTRRDRLRALNAELVRRTVEPMLLDVQDKLQASKNAQDYLAEVKEDIIAQTELFLRDTTPHRSSPGEAPEPTAAMNPDDLFWRYEINVIVNNDATKGAPVIHEPHPTLANLVGRIEMTPQFGTLVTDFTRIKAGALHRAAGGFLILNASDLLSQPLAWEALKRSLRREQVVIETMERVAGYAPTASLEPEPVPLNVKVALVGSRDLYYLLRLRDPDFDELFKVQADFNETVDRSADTTQSLAQLFGAISRRAGLRAIDPSGAAAAAEFAARAAGDARKYLIMVSPLADLLREADFYAAKREAEAIGRQDIALAIEAQERRADRPREHYLESVVRGFTLVDTDGAAVGQINGLTVVDGGVFAFGRPARITARVRAGSGQVVDIEREVALGGKLHSKGVLILSGYLASAFLPDHPLSLAASLVFEQSYGGVDGDSASTAELIALMSAIAEVPIKQSIAITGAINQHGQVQAIGGVNEKIEGFFSICAARGLTGSQGVIIPQSNVQNLMLKENVAEAVKAQTFTIWPVTHVDEAITLLTGLTAGVRVRGKFPKDSFNRKVADRLLAFANAAKRNGAKPR